MSAVSSLIDELKRRNVLKVVTAYAVAGFVLLQLCDILFPALGLADEIIGYILIGLIVCLPLIVTFVWMFELTPDGLKRTQEVSSDDSISQFTGQRINNVIIFLLSVAVVFFAYEYFFPTETVVEVAESQQAPVTGEVIESPASPVDGRPSIAVLPFVNMSSDKENEYFSDGLSEEVLNLLAQIEGLRVAGRTSSFFYKGKNENLTMIGEELNVDHILEGSVRKSGDKVRITAQLISAQDGFHLWSKTFDRQINDIFAVQDEIAGEVTRAMQVTLLTDGIMIADRSTTNPETYDLYLRGKAALYDRGVDNVRLSIDLFRQAIALDPEYAPAYVDLTVSELILNWNYNASSLAESLENAEHALGKLEELGYDNADYYAVKGLYHSTAAVLDASHHRLAAAAFQKSIDLNANDVRPYMWWATQVSQTDAPDRFERSVALTEKALQLDPLNRVANGNHAGNLADVGRIEEAVKHLDRLIRIDPDYDFYAAARTNLYLSIHDYENAAASLVEMSKSILQYPFLAANVFFAFDDEEGWLNFIDTVPVDNPAIEYVHLQEMALTATRGELKAEAEVLLLKPDPEFFAGPVVFDLMTHGEFDLARRLIENAREDFKNDVPRNDFTNGPDPRFNYLTAIYKLGQIDRSNRYAQHLLNANRTAPYLGPGGRGIDDVYCYLVLGRRAEAIAELARATDAGWLGFYQEAFEQDPLLSELLDEPGVQRLKSEIDRKLARQKDSVYATLRANGLINAI